ncbi:carbohydrate-binding protein [Clostridium taeniosporum]|uniref:Carbohydrate binding module family 25 domain-containing protein n=1 Tax=Clostridium taeniosporum TaxID=394958 RepID=A0A1D7XJ49_9CLOT|nr:carbohydrate-binding protein [Clostridium taeniosporum]AOR23361.1 hypothetical protein BGI42_06270 [Clostridium taeniosporum]
MKKILTFMMVTLLLCTFMMPKTAMAAENNEKIAYTICMPFNYSKFNTTDVKNVTLHYGINGWNNVKDIKMNRRVSDYYMGRTFETFFTTIYVEKGSTVDYCFKQDWNNNEVKWDNNNNNDYHVVVNESNIK